MNFLSKLAAVTALGLSSCMGSRYAEEDRLFPDMPYQAAEETDMKHYGGIATKGKYVLTRGPIAVDEPVVQVDVGVTNVEEGLDFSLWTNLLARDGESTEVDFAGKKFGQLTEHISYQIKPGVYVFPNTGMQPVYDVQAKLEFKYEFASPWLLAAYNHNQFSPGAYLEVGAAREFTIKDAKFTLSTQVGYNDHQFISDSEFSHVLTKLSAPLPLPWLGDVTLELNHQEALGRNFEDASWVGLSKRLTF